MYKKTINCRSCEVKCDVIIRQTNFDDEEMPIEFCPICSASLEDQQFEYDDDMELAEW